MHINDSECPQSDSCHAGQLASHQLNNLLNLTVTLVQTSLQSEINILIKV